MNDDSQQTKAIPVFQLKSSDDLTESEVDALYSLNLRIYPDYARYYEVNRFYSSMQPL